MLDRLIESYKKDTESVYYTWFLNSEERIKAFRTIRKSLMQVVAEIENGEFGNDFKGSSLELAVTSISEQKQVFEGAAHAFFWKPKLRIPDINENEQNKRAFGRFLRASIEANSAEKAVSEINSLKSLGIKGLGPAAANLLYFLHPTWFPPFNTAIVNGYNIIFNEKKKLGSWDAYLEMREVLLKVNSDFRNSLSKDLGALAGLLFEIGSCRMVIEENASQYIEKQEKAKQKRRKEVALDESEGNSHTEMQYHLARLGKSLGYNVWIARNDHKREWNGVKLGEFSLKNLKLSACPLIVSDTISLIDVLWLDCETDQIIGGFEVEKSTSIYSGILRLTDLSLSIPHDTCQFYLVAPDKREKDIKAQLLRPSIQAMENNNFSYILFSDLRCDCDAMCKFGENASVLKKISKTV